MTNYDKADLAQSDINLLKPKELKPVFLGAEIEKKKAIEKVNSSYVIQCYIMLCDFNWL